jgi:hypothetical protein
VDKLLLPLLFFLYLCNAPLSAQNLPSKLSEKSTISVLTCAPGDELYSIFGHTAIRISDPIHELDLAFNYGTFDFNTPFFYFKFGHGSLNYLLSVSTFKQFMREYFIEGRSVWEQELKLTPIQRNKLFRDLIINARPQNRAYKYDFFYDNCATRVVDIVLRQYPETLSFPLSPGTDKLTFRQAVHPYLQAKPWTRIGIDFILGAPADALTDSVSIMFLPDHLMEQFAGITCSNDSDNYKLVKSQSMILDFKDNERIESNTISPLVILWVVTLLVVLLSVAEIFGYIRFKIFDIIVFSIAGIAGIVIFYLAFISSHIVTNPNWNLLWANPVWLLFTMSVNKLWIRFLKWIQVVSLLFFLFFFFFLPQTFAVEFIPIVIVLFIRLGKPFRWLLKKKKKRIGYNSNSVPSILICTK